MATQAEVMNTLINRTLDGTVFGPGQAFDANVQERLPDILSQIEAIAGIMSHDIHACVSAGYPDMPEGFADVVTGETVPKAGVFVPFLSVGELPGERNTRLLASAGMMVGCMYISNTLMDRRIPCVQTAIERWCNPDASLERQPDPLIDRRLQVLQYIDAKVLEVANPEDAPYVLGQYKRVLRYEAALRSLSDEYIALDPAARQAFLAQRAGRIVSYMVDDAGFPSVTDTLYAIYRQNDETLPSLAEIHNNETIEHILDACNGAARVGDDFGDAPEDTGENPEWGAANINLFNQYHPLMIDALCERVGIADTDRIKTIQETFAAYSKGTPETHAKYGKRVLDIFFGHTRELILTAEAELPALATYLGLCKRVLEISRVNGEMGDTAMSSTH